MEINARLKMFQVWRISNKIWKKFEHQRNVNKNRLQ